jgi:hypothetical protein
MSNKINKEELEKWLFEKLFETSAKRFLPSWRDEDEDAYNQIVALIKSGNE